jgi:two-component system NtrC family response regulator
VRIVAATHQDLKAHVGQGTFREDLYYRLAEIVVKVPPLRDRIGDKALLAHAFVKRFAAEQRRGSLTLSEDALRAVESHAWPGNVRELENAIKRAVIMSEGNVITAEDVDLGDAQADDAERFNLRKIRDEAERRAVVQAIARSNDNIAKAAELLGVSRPTLYDLMHRFGLK